MTALLKVTNLQVHFKTPFGVVKANNGVNLEVAPGAATGIMGESGCGKTVLFLSLLRLQEPGRIAGGSIHFNGIDVLKLPERQVRRIRGRQIGFIPQNQATAFNPSYTIGQHLQEVIRLREHGSGLWQHIGGSRTNRKGQSDEIEKLLTDLGLGDAVRNGKVLKSYPHQLSGGMRQRVLTAMALIQNPALLIADEPTTALDRANRSQVLNILKDIKGRTTLLLVSHDIETITGVCDMIAVMYCGRIIERGPAADILANPLHPYTRILLSCRKFSRNMTLPQIFVDSQDLINPPEGCSFHPYCPHAGPLCSKHLPDECIVGQVRVSCHLYYEGVKC